MTLCVDRLETAGKLLYGDVWQTNLARDLGIDSRLVRQWCAKERVMRYEYYQKIVQLLTERQKLIGEHLVLLESNRSQIDHCRRLIPVLTGNSKCSLTSLMIFSVNPRTYGEQGL